MTRNFEKISGAVLKRETEKAVLLNVKYGDAVVCGVWFPKSQIEIRENGIFATAWIIDQKSLSPSEAFEKTGDYATLHIETETI